MLGLSRVGKSYEREAFLVLDTISALGGLGSIFFYILAPTLIRVFIKPFNDLEIAINFSMIRLIDGLATVQEESMIRKFKDRFTFRFYFYYFWIYNGLCRCVLDSCFKRKKDRVEEQSPATEEEDEVIEQMADYFNRI